MTDTKNQKKKEGFKPVSPKTDFIKLEKDLLEKWYKKGIVKKYLQKNNSAKQNFSFLDGPITANNPMGVHHGWGRTYKDFWQRYWNMQGKKQRFQNGFDEQGLWVEVEVEKELGLKTKKDIENLIPGDKFKSLEKFITLCKERVKKFSNVQTEQSKRLGYFMDWDNSYHTSSPQNNYAIWNFIKTVHHNGWLYKGRDSVPWCPRCGTAISQHEILTEEYKQITHRTVVFKLKVKGKENEYLLAWTTTPWTVPGNVALAVDQKETYWKMKSPNGETVILIDPTKKIEGEQSFVQKTKLTENLKKVEEIKGKDLVGLEYEAPFDFLPKVKKDLGKYTHRVVSSDPLILPINTQEGTGIVHLAPGAGTEDFQLGKKEKLPVIEEIDEEGVFIEGFEFLSALTVRDASKKVLSYLDENNFAFKIIDYTHRYPTCWRCKTELVWRVVDEWYIAMDKPSKSKVKSQKSKDQEKTYREQMMEVAKKINWMPGWGLDRELDWLKNMHDWLISKKRYWGLALPIWECKKCGSFEVIGSEMELREKAADGFKKFEGHTPHRPWIDLVKIKCPKCSSLISRISDVGNPWLDAGIVPFSTMPQEWFPSDFITESFPGQFKNWFYSLIAMSTALGNTNPFKRVLGFATVMDEKGEPMHKSKGNMVEFNEAADKIGVDVMRWLYLRTNPEHNLNFGYHVADEVRRFFHLRLWNVYSFFVTYANVDNWHPQIQNLKFKIQNSSVLDRWIMSRLNKNIKNIKISIESYKANEAVDYAENFVINDLSNWYVRRIRDRVGPGSENKEDKDNAYKTLYKVLTEYSKALAPFIPFTADEIYTNLTGEESVHLADFPISDDLLIDEELEKEMAFGTELASVIHGARKLENIKVRIPIKKLSYKGQIELSKNVLKIVEEEVNVYNLEFLGKSNNIEIQGELSDPSNQDQEAGLAREIIRRIQEERKKLGTRPDEKVFVAIEEWPKEFENEIKRKALVSSLEKGEFEVKRQP